MIVPPSGGTNIERGRGLARIVAMQSVLIRTARTWRPVKRWTGCGASGDERQSVGTFTDYLVRYIGTASKIYEQQLIKMGRPNAIICNPYPTKKE